MSGASRFCADAPICFADNAHYKTFLNEEPRMDADQHGFKRKEETGHSQFGAAESQKQSVSICVHPRFKSGSTNSSIVVRLPNCIRPFTTHIACDNTDSTDVDR